MAYNCRLQCDQFILWLADVIIVILVIYFQTVRAAYQGFSIVKSLKWRGSSLAEYSFKHSQETIVNLFNSYSFQLRCAEKLVVCYCKETYWFRLQQPGYRRQHMFSSSIHRDMTGWSLYSGRSFLPFVWNLITHQHRQEREDKTYCQVFGAQPVFSPTHT